MTATDAEDGWRSRGSCQVSQEEGRQAEKCAQGAFQGNKTICVPFISV